VDQKFHARTEGISNNSTVPDWIVFVILRLANYLSLRHQRSTMPNPKRFSLLLTAALAAAVFLNRVPAGAAEPTPPPGPGQPPIAQTVSEPTRKPDVIYVGTPQRVVEKMLEMAQIKRGDVVYDLGCGDGRIVVTAARKYGVRAVGFDIDPQRVKEALENVRSNKVEALVTIKQADIFTVDLRPASVVTLYLLPDLNVRLMPQLAQLKPGSRIVSHEFDMQGAKPAQIERLSIPSAEEPEQDSGEHTLYKWTVPWEKVPADEGKSTK
jgi:SAM-dependent methyltransferase